jgi:hypothetical protein
MQDVHTRERRARAARDVPSDSSKENEPRFVGFSYAHLVRFFLKGAVFIFSKKGD